MRQSAEGATSLARVAAYLEAVGVSGVEGRAHHVLILAALEGGVSSLAPPCSSRMEDDTVCELQ